MKFPARFWVSPAGAAVALVCFFLPWYDYSCGEQIRTVRGLDMGWPVWAAPAAAAGMLVAFAVAWRRGDPARARTTIAALSLVLPALLALLAFMALSEGIRFGFRPVSPGEGKYHAVRYGLVGEVLGLLAALVGTRGMRPAGDGTPAPRA
jgi:hypothetical protein